MVCFEEDLGSEPWNLKLLKVITHSSRQNIKILDGIQILNLYTRITPTLFILYLIVFLHIFATIFDRFRSIKFRNKVSDKSFGKLKNSVSINHCFSFSNTFKKLYVQ